MGSERNQHVGFDIMVNGTTVRTFRDREDRVIAAAKQLAGKCDNDPARVRSRLTGATVTGTADGKVEPN
jgi:hypothetical protein